MRYPIWTLLYELFIEPVLRIIEKLLGVPIALFFGVGRAGRAAFQWLQIKVHRKTTVSKAA